LLKVALNRINQIKSNHWKIHSMKRRHLDSTGWPAIIASFLFLSLAHLTQMVVWAIVSDWPIFQKKILKPLGQMNRNLVGSIFGRSSVKNAHFVPMR
jgi:hypothetical protein